jgi:phosphomannomutase/phosphoglucomutase
VILGGDGRSLTAELLAAASEGLRAAGCRVIDTGAVTSGCLARAIAAREADGGLHVSNAAGWSHTASLRAWGQRGCPWSAPGRLVAVRQIFENGVDRPVRSYGALERSAVEDVYLSELQDCFHALRPLRVVLDTSCGPLAKLLERLLSNSACQIIRPREPDTHARADSSGGTPKRPAPQSFLQGRLELVRRQVRADRAHFGVWIDGDGEVFHLIDERGFRVHPERCLVMLARHRIGRQPESAVVLERDASPQTLQAITSMGGRVTLADATRQAIFEAMATGGAVIAGGPSGRVFIAADAVDAGVAAADALRMLSLLLPLLSQTDRPLSEVLDTG